ncbi:MAG TPA: adenosine kinase, partial [Acidimicrobiales bacterium]
MTDATTSAIPPADLDVVAVGNAIVDVIAHTDDAFLVKHELDKGSMRLIDTDQAGRLYEAMGPGTESSGGSAANTVAGVAALGGRAGFVGKVRDDQLGEVFAHDIKAIGVDFASPPATDGPPTARCLILVTPDAQRTMNTYLGTAGLLTPDDIDPAFVASAQITYGEGYLWAEPGAKAALTEAFATARAAGRRTA